MTSYAIRDSATMLRRNLRHLIRYPSLTFYLIGMPIIFLLLFVYVFGGTLGSGLGGQSGGRSAYLAYVVPGIILMTVATGAQGSALSVAMDMQDGIIARFRTMAIARVSVLTGHVIGTVIKTVIGLTVIVGVALALGFRPNATPVEWLAMLGVVVVITFALVWLTVAMGLAAKNVESASNLPTPLVFLPFLSSGFVPTDSMPAGLKQFAAYQPFTPIIETIRGLLLGTGIGNAVILTLAWSAGIALVGYLWAKKLYNRDPSR